MKTRKSARTINPQAMANSQRDVFNEPWWCNDK